MQSVSCSRIIGNQHNLVRSAALSVTAQRASTQLLQLLQRRKGNGRMVLSGPYTGAADSVIDVEVLGGAAGDLRASSPVVNGVGNGLLQVQGIDVGAAAQTLRFTLLDVGTQPVPAMLDFFGVQLAARAQGALGNSVSLSVQRSLSYTDLPFATLDSLSAGSAQFDGPQYDWGQPAATGADIPAAALRMAFAGLPTVHRAWKVWEQSAFAYRIDPPLAYAVPENTRIREVTGHYTITLADGVATEVYTAVTMYDFLTQVQARSALVQVLGVVAQDRAPGGQAATDIPLRTDAHALPAIASANRAARLQVGEVSPGAATQNITITCLGRSGAGQAWSVVGGVVGALPAAYTGQPYTAGPVQFTIPQPVVATALDASITGRFSPAARQTGEGLPAICFKPLLLGAAATDKEVSFVYTKRPPAECSCTAQPALHVSLQCLGLDTQGALNMDPLMQTRLVALMQWRADFVGANTKLVPGNPVNAAIVGRDAMDVFIAQACSRVFVTALQEVYDSPEALIEWDAAFVALKAELLGFRTMTSSTAESSSNQERADVFAIKYTALMDSCRAQAGIVPKSDAGSAGSPCWRDHGGGFWWEDASGDYLPAFTNQPFVSAMRTADGSIVSTQEFGFGLVTQCEHRLKEGDRITIKISGSHNPSTWAEGDRFVIPLIAAGSAPLTGGSDGDPTQTWTARSSLLGALPDWHWLPSAPAPWAHAPATVALSPGGIPFEVGDSIAFDIEGGRLRWRRDAGAWVEADLYASTPHDLGDGLRLQAAPGAAPSFLADDAWQFSAVATHGTARMRQPRIGQAFAWDGADVTLDIDLGSEQPIEAVMLAMHSIAPTATVTITGGLAAADEWTAPAAIHPCIIIAPAPVTTARHLRIAITGAGMGGSIGWLWAGMAWRPTVGPSSITRQRQYGLARGQGINPAALYRGAGTGGSWTWSLDQGAALLADNAQQLIELIDHSAAQGLEPLALVPDLRSTFDASIALIDADQIEMNEMNNWQAQNTRVVGLSLPLRAVLA